MNIFEPKLINSPNRDRLFTANIRMNSEYVYSVYKEACETGVWFNPITNQAEIV